MKTTAKSNLERSAAVNHLTTKLQPSVIAAVPQFLNWKFMGIQNVNLLEVVRVFRSNLNFNFKFQTKLTTYFLHSNLNQI